MKLKHYLVYLITNTVNGKIYVGKHETFDPDDDYMGSGNLLKRAQNKYGLDKFTKTILADFDEPWSMANMEATIVDEEFIKRKDTYNITVGGNGGFYHCQGIHHNNLHNHRRTGFLALLDKGINASLAWRQDLTAEEQLEVLKRISEGVKKHYHEHGSAWLGHRHSKESRDKMHITHLATGHQQGSKNSQYGKHWWHDPVTGEAHSFHDKDVPSGWVRGRT